MKKKSILLIGGCGYIGLHLLKNLKNYKVFILDKTNNINKILYAKKYAQVNNKKVSNNTLKKSIDYHSVDTVVYLASKLKFKNIKLAKFEIKNLKEVIFFVKKKNIKNFIYFSSSSVYGNCNNKISENTQRNPVSNYGKLKLKSENLITKEFKKTKLKYIILRPFNFIGVYSKLKGKPIIFKNNIFFNLLNSINLEKLFYLNGKNLNTIDGSCERDYLDIDNFSKIFFKLLNNIFKLKSGAYNIGTGKTISNLHIINSFRKYYKRKIKIKYTKKKYDNPIRLIPKINKILKFIALNDLKFQYMKAIKSYDIYLKK